MSTKEMISPKALVHSRTVVEKHDYVTTGISIFVEGDLLGIELNEYKRFELGDAVQMTFYSPVGIHRLQSTVIGKDEGSIAVIFPPRAFQFVEKRESPRVEVTATGNLRLQQEEEEEFLLLQAQQQAHPEWNHIKSPDELDDEELLAHLHELNEQHDERTDKLQISLRNISLSGVGFVLEQSSMRLSVGDTVEAELQVGLDGAIRCDLIIVRRELQPDGFYYGARIDGVGEKQHRALRAFILREQVGLFYHNRNKQMKNKSRSSD
ncbi:type IV pilus assembly PilZ [Paenibacillus curdlanolyticus YK9]|uniref:Type IV pilus assembly PilZ n=1 Tax=Paenibacillus curdlanolyticus YK9 TaxID=717606 RepID=E0I9T5_9BACL|nr:PilZ domain-containing protein [Paenibacillus curdlanolyticus]EFM10512.1 type IV pilus assembly PilZ [Paenibacillus curdlanolyticus YK9]